jgi:hypothetical protein
VNIYIAVISVLTMAASGAAFVRHLYLLADAKEDDRAMRQVEGASPALTSFFIKANYVHLIKMSIIFFASTVVLMDEVYFPDAQGELRLIVVPSVLLVVTALATLLGTLETRARESMNRFYDEI